jgi:hypothetical protein
VTAPYEWLLDGKVIAKGTVRLVGDPTGAKQSVIDLPAKFAKARENLTFRLKNANDLVPANNELMVQTDAVTVGFWVERSLWEYMHEHQFRLPTNDANSFCGWGQRMMRQWNSMFKEAVYERFPNGITERVRLDQVTVVPDFALPLASGLPSNNPDLRDKTVDMTWGMESGDVLPGVTLKPDHWWSPEGAILRLNNGDVKARKVDPPFWCGLGYIHEMNHARYLIDSYGFDLSYDVAKPNVKVQDEAGPIAGRYFPAKSGVIRWNKQVGQMGGDYWSFSAYEAMCWNRVRGQRARGGNCNSPATIGEFLQEIPKRVVIAFEDAAGNPLTEADVWVYRSHGTGEGWYTKVYEDKPDQLKRADKNGKVVFDRTLWAPDGKIRHDYGVANSVALLRVTYRGQHYFGFEDVTDSNIAYNLGMRDEVVLRRRVRLRTGDPKPEDWDSRDAWEVPGTTFHERPAGWVDPRLMK